MGDTLVGVGDDGSLEPPTVDDSGGQSYDESSGETQGGNPVWKQYLDFVPQDQHAEAEAFLAARDKEVTQRFQKVHSDYESWKPFKEAGVSAQDAQFGIQLVNALQTNPKEVWAEIGKMYNLTQEQGLGEPNQEVAPSEDSEYQKIKHQLDLVSQVVVNQRQQDEYDSQVDAESAKLDVELTDAHKKYGDFNEQWVLSLMDTSGLSAMEAAKAYHDEISRYAPRPLFGTGGGMLPGQGTTPSKMTDTELNKYVSDVLQASKRQAQG